MKTVPRRRLSVRSVEAAVRVGGVRVARARGGDIEVAAEGAVVLVVLHDLFVGRDEEVVGVGLDAESLRKRLGVPLVGSLPHVTEKLLLLLVAAANVFYCIGPLIEVYAFLVTGIECERARILLLRVGALFSATLLTMAF